MALSELLKNLKIAGVSHGVPSTLRSGAGLVLFFVSLLWAGCGETETPHTANGAGRFADRRSGRCRHGRDVGRR